ncbi:helix-turn-helix domain-containing protein [Anaerosphaera multitolerans]|uniref:XRE family transcriptional regulator n=1 Tax=Anaerosphaera multitolerans TaxID=2487351 RepID=A0A437S6K8_9FIRM|nr:helix-turn-helix transcriptional regulator [Anaerosphaera multitolerans]RVU54649.1 XRE family transcriptional regulator [Anaerosphaera multitolerans]
MNFGEILKKLRSEKRITQKELGEIIGKSNRVISYYENEIGKDNYPDKETLEKIAKYFNVSISYLMGLDTDKMSPEMVLLDKLIDKTSAGLISWAEINNSYEFDLVYDLSNTSFPFESTSNGPYGTNYSIESFDTKVFDLYIANIGGNEYLLINYSDHPNNSINLYIITGESEEDIIHIDESTAGYLLKDLLEIVKGETDYNPTKKIKNLIDDLDNLNNQSNQTQDTKNNSFEADDYEMPF